MYLLIDCNNFYVSCERVFQPKLKQVPVIILSNNDGCIISRSQEVKDLGIPMGAPIFKYKPMLAQHGIRTFSSNFALYGDMSHRVMDAIANLNEHNEIYSVDEAFMRVPEWTNEELLSYGREAQATIERWTGIPISIGIGQTKTLAKAANHIAKKQRQYGGVFSMGDPAGHDAILSRVAVNSIWGVGRQTTKFLEQFDITNAAQLKAAPEEWVRKHLHLPGLRTVQELRGIRCYEMEEGFVPRKGILTSRSFGIEITALSALEEAISVCTARTAEKLRAQGSAAGAVHVFIETNRFRSNAAGWYSNSRTIHLPSPTAHTPTLVEYAHQSLRALFRPGYAYKRAGIWLTDIVPEGTLQGNLFGQEYTQRQKDLMATMDGINARWGSHTIQTALCGTRTGWWGRRHSISPRFTTVWSEIPRVRA